MRDLTPLLSPRSVAVVGASSNLESLSGRPVKNLLASGAAIAVYPVNPRREEIAGLRCYPDIADVPEAPDVVLILTPAATVAATLEAAGRRGAKSAVVISSGFAEVGADGARTQRRLAEVARAHGMVLVGPNTIGLQDYRRGLPLSFVWFGRRPTSSAGSVAVVTKSGSGMASLCDRLLDLDLPLGHGVATGNEADLSITDLIEYFAEQDEVRVVVTVLEEVRDGARFLAACRRLRELGKPLVALKLGRTESGSVVARSHTGALAGSYPVLRALFRQHGVLEVDDLDDIGPTIAAVLPGKFPAGRRFAVVTSSGGAAVICADRADEVGLQLPEFSPGAQQRIREYLPIFSSGRVHNPLDLTAQASEHPFAMTEILSIALAEKDLDAVIVGTPSGAGQYGLALADRIAAVAASAEKPVLSFMLSGGEGSAQRRRQRDGGLPVFESPGKAVEALERLARFALSRPRPGPAAQGTAGGGAPAGPLSEFETLCWLAAHGVPTVEQRLARTSEEAVAAAADLGLPVAVKVSSPDIAHKTEAGGVCLDLQDADSVAAAFHAVTAAGRRAVPTASIDGVTVSPMIRSTVELIAGVHRDPTFGLVLALGLGGIWTEVFGDVALRALPLAAEDVAEMVDELRGKALLRGARGRTPVDQAALATLVLALSRIALDCGPRLRSIDLNPVAVTDRGSPLVLDAAVYLGQG
ncbi:MAG: acetate--CoA ligase family protein [Trebonia sp.]